MISYISVLFWGFDNARSNRRFYKGRERGRMSQKSIARCRFPRLSSSPWQCTSNAYGNCGEPKYMSPMKG